MTFMVSTMAIGLLFVLAIATFCFALGRSWSPLWGLAWFVGRLYRLGARGAAVVALVILAALEPRLALAATTTGPTYWQASGVEGFVVSVGGLVITGCVSIVSCLVGSHLKIAKGSALAALLSNFIGAGAQLVIAELDSLVAHNPAIDVHNPTLAGWLNTASPQVLDAMKAEGITQDTVAQRIVGAVKSALTPAVVTAGTPVAVAPVTPVPAAPPAAPAAV